MIYVWRYILEYIYNSCSIYVLTSTSIVLYAGKIYPGIYIQLLFYLCSDQCLYCSTCPECKEFLNYVNKYIYIDPNHTSMVLYTLNYNSMVLDSTSIVLYVLDITYIVLNVLDITFFVLYVMDIPSIVLYVVKKNTLKNVLAQNLFWKVFVA